MVNVKLLNVAPFGAQGAEIGVSRPTLKIFAGMLVNLRLYKLGSPQLGLHLSRLSPFLLGVFWACVGVKGLKFFSISLRLRTR